MGLCEAKASSGLLWKAFPPDMAKSRTDTLNGSQIQYHFPFEMPCGTSRTAVEGLEN